MSDIRSHLSRIVWVAQTAQAESGWPPVLFGLCRQAECGWLTSHCWPESSIRSQTPDRCDRLHETNQNIIQGFSVTGFAA